MKLSPLMEIIILIFDRVLLKMFWYNKEFSKHYKAKKLESMTNKEMKELEARVVSTICLSLKNEIHCFEWKNILLGVSIALLETKNIKQSSSSSHIGQTVMMNSKPHHHRSKSKEKYLIGGWSFHSHLWRNMKYYYCEKKIYQEIL